MRTLIIIVLVIILFLAFLSFYINREKKREKEENIRAEQIRRSNVIKDIVKLSDQIDNDEQCREFFKFLDDIILPQQSTLKSIRFNGYTVEIQSQIGDPSHFMIDKSHIVKVDLTRFDLSLSADYQQVAFVYSIQKRYDFMEYICCGERTNNLAKVYFDSTDDCGHGSALILYGLYK